MVGVRPSLSPGSLAATLAALPVRVDTAHVTRNDVWLVDYPNGPRPSSVVRLKGEGATGLGENIAFFVQEQEQFAAFVESWLGAHAGSRLHVGSALGAGGTPYERAALEAALLDLGMRQAGLSLHALTGVRAAELRFVVSLAAYRQPEPVIRSLRALGYAGELKLDVDPSWSAATLETLANDPSIAIFDFKSRADPTLAGRLYAKVDRALLEDPPSGFEAPTRAHEPRRIARDASILDERAVSAARARGESVNLKAPRMGGPLELLRGLERALFPNEIVRGMRESAYFGGMFEVGVGRRQARQLAALYCSTAPNDLSLNEAARAAPRRSSPAVIRLDQPGFGG
jgi:L-alanine-DL-glutamate epimerase-like enolase superfamily enzyme